MVLTDVLYDLISGLFGIIMGALVSFAVNYKRNKRLMQEIIASQNALEEMRKEIQAKAEKFDKEINEQTPANIRERRQQELQEMYQKFQQAQDDNLEAFRQEQQQKLQPLQERVLAAVKEIITEGGYVIAFEKSNTEAAFSVLNETLIEDINAKLKAKLGI